MADERHGRVACEVGTDAPEVGVDGIAALDRRLSVHLENAIRQEQLGELVEVTGVGTMRVRRDRLADRLPRRELPDLHHAGRNDTSATVSETGSSATITGRSSRSSSFAMPSRLPTRRGPSSSSATTIAYGGSYAGSTARCVIVQVNTRARPDARSQVTSGDPHTAQRWRGGCRHTPHAPHRWSRSSPFAQNA